MNLVDFTAAVSGLTNGNLTIAFPSSKPRVFQNARYVGVSGNQPVTATFASAVGTCHFVVDEVEFLVVAPIPAKEGGKKGKGKKAKKRS